MTKEVTRIAQSIIDKAHSTGKVIGVFVTNGAVRMTATTTNLYQDAVKRKASSLMGAYDAHCPLSWLVDDLDAMGVK